MMPMALMACAALFWGASALSIHAQSKQFGRLMQEDCHTAVEGDDCYQHVNWAMTRGIKYHAKQFPSTLSASSSFEDFQAYLHTLDKLQGVCSTPCVSASERVEAPCRTAAQGEDCFVEVEWAMQEGFVQHPEWYPTLTSASTFEDFQAFLHSFDNATHVCGKPCEAPERKVEACRTSVQGDECFIQVKWAMEKGWPEHPGWYPTLTSESTFEDFQTFLHGQSPKVCTMPCLAGQQDKQEEKVTRSEEQLPVKQEEETTQSEQPAVEECHTSVEGEKCHEEVSWAKTTGIAEHPNWYPSLTPASSFEDFQAYMHATSTFSKVCAKPCDVQQRNVEPPAEETVAKVEPPQEEAAKQKDELPAQGEVTDGGDQPPAEETAAKAEPAQEEATKQKTDGGDQPPAEEAVAKVEPAQEKAAKQEDELPAQEEVADGGDQLPASEEVQTGDCHTAVKGDVCYKIVTWSMNRGIKWHPKWYGGLTSSSTFQEFQSFLHGKKRKCPKPCMEAPTSSQQVGADAAKKETTAQAAADVAAQPVAEEPSAAEDADAATKDTTTQAAADVAAQPAAEEPSAPKDVMTKQEDQLPAKEKVQEEEEKCHTAVKGEACHKRVLWAMSGGIDEHPEWYWPLTKKSSFEDFQRHLYSSARAAAVCTTMPCDVQEQEDQSQADEATKQGDQFSDKHEVQTGVCHTAVKGEPCYRKVNWARSRGMRWHPDRFPGLTSTSSFEEVQAWLSSKKMGKCPQPCAAASGEKVAAEDGKRPQAGAAEVAERAAPQEAVAKEDAPLLEDSDEPTKIDKASDLDSAAEQEETPPGFAPAESAQKPAGQDEGILAPQDLSPQMPTKQGCYMSQPTGCTNHPEVASRHGEWVKDEVGQALDSDEILCLGRGPANNEWCGVENTKMLWNPPPPPMPPSEKGCYVWKPSGCPRKNQKADGSGWKPDITKTHEQAATTMEACMARKAPFDKYCGTTSIKMMYVS